MNYFALFRRGEDIMITIGAHKELTTNKARLGEASGSVRYVLGIGVALAVIAGIILYFAYV